MNHKVKVPGNYTDWNSHNEGKEKLLIEFMPGVDTEEYMWNSDT